MVNVALPPLAKAPIVQMGEVHVVPADGVTVTTEYPAGRLSVTLTPVAALGPLLVAVIVKVTLLPTLGVRLSTVLTTLKSVIGTGVGVTVEVLLAKIGST